MGYLFKNQCFSTLDQATAAHWSEQPAFMTSGTTSYLSDFVWSGSIWQVNKYTVSAAGTMTLNSTTALPALTFPTCETDETFNDGMTLGWGVAIAMAAVWGVKFLSRALYR